MRAVRTVGGRELHSLRALRWLFPAVAHESDAAQTASHRFDRAKQSLHWTPAEFAMAHIEDREVLVACLRRAFPIRVVPVEEKWAHGVVQRMEGRLADLVGEAVAYLDPPLPRRLVAMVVITFGTEHWVVVAVAVEDNAPFSRDFPDEPKEVEVISFLQRGRPLEDEQHRIGPS